MLWLSLAWLLSAGVALRPQVANTIAAANDTEPQIHEDKTKHYNEKLGGNETKCEDCSVAEEALVLAFRKARDAHASAQESAMDLSSARAALAAEEEKLAHEHDFFNSKLDQLSPLTVTTLDAVFEEYCDKVAELRQSADRARQNEASKESAQTALDAAQASYDSAALVAGDADAEVQVAQVEADAKCGHLVAAVDDTDADGYVLLLKDHEYFGNKDPDLVDPIKTGSFVGLKAVYKSGPGVDCCCQQGPRVWQKCSSGNDDIWSFEFKKNSDFVVEQQSYGKLPSECTAPTTPTGDIICDVDFTLGPGDRVLATWFEPSHHQGEWNNGGSIVVDIYGKRSTVPVSTV